MKDFKQEIQSDYLEMIECQICDSKHDYLMTQIFEIYTYDSGDISKVICDNMLSICDVILKRENFEYIQDIEKYFQFILLINMPFFLNTTEFGTSIRGSWFNECKDYVFSGRINVKGSEIKEFIKQLIEWYKEN